MLKIASDDTGNIDVTRFTGGLHIEAANTADNHPILTPASEAAISFLIISVSFSELILNVSCAGAPDFAIRISWSIYRNTDCLSVRGETIRISNFPPDFPCRGFKYVLRVDRNVFVCSNKR